MSDEETLTLEITYDDACALITMAAIVQDLNGTQIPLTEGRKVFNLLLKLEPEFERLGWLTRPT